MIEDSLKIKDLSFNFRNFNYTIVEILSLDEISFQIQTELNLFTFLYDTTYINDRKYNNIEDIKQIIN